ncbi:MAG: class F sortase [Candidatus Nomurabacteria bacterium]|jgi:LPXTG-site transpeptidase (sortase) family protein|nr:class F sortase [Candidatus Nomurabacteria bacterium]
MERQTPQRRSLDNRGAINVPTSRRQMSVPTRAQLATARNSSKTVAKTTVAQAKKPIAAAAPPQRVTLENFNYQSHAAPHTTKASTPAPAAPTPTPAPTPAVRSVPAVANPLRPVMTQFMPRSGQAIPRPPQPRMMIPAGAAPYGALTVPIPMQPGMMVPGTQVKNPNQKNLKDTVARVKDKSKKYARKLKEEKLKNVKKTDVVRYAVVALFIALSGYLAYDTWVTNKQIQGVFQPEVSAAQQPAETAPQPTANHDGDGGYPDHHVEPDKPRIISIPKIGVKAMIIQVGVSSANKIESPTNYYDPTVGWYNGSSLPGTEGASFMTGHYNGGSGGIFDHLNQLAAGDKLAVERGDGAWFDYEVVGTQYLNVSEIDMASALSVYEGGKEGLNLMTCGGQFTASGYTHRTIVYTKRV